MDLGCLGKSDVGRGRRTSLAKDLVFVSSQRREMVATGPLHLSNRVSQSQLTDLDLAILKEA